MVSEFSDYNQKSVLVLVIYYDNLQTDTATSNKLKENADLSADQTSERWKVFLCIRIHVRSQLSAGFIVAASCCAEGSTGGVCLINVM